MPRANWGRAGVALRKSLYTASLYSGHSLLLTRDPENPNNVIPLFRFSVPKEPTNGNGTGEYIWPRSRGLGSGPSLTTIFTTWFRQSRHQPARGNLAFAILTPNIRNHAAMATTRTRCFAAIPPVAPLRPLIIFIARAVFTWLPAAKWERHGAELSLSDNLRLPRCGGTEMGALSALLQWNQHPPAGFSNPAKRKYSTGSRQKVHGHSNGGMPRSAVHLLAWLSEPGG